MNEQTNPGIELTDEEFFDLDDTCTEEELQEAVQGYLGGDLTMAQLAGLTIEELYWMARVGYDLMENGQLDEARMIFRGLTEEDPFDATFHALLGSVAQKQHQVREAIGHYNRASQLNPDDPYVLLNSGELKIGLSDQLFTEGDATAAAAMLEDGLKDLRRVVDADKELKSPAGVRGRLLLEIVSQQVASG